MWQGIDADRGKVSGHFTQQVVRWRFGDDSDTLGRCITQRFRFRVGHPVDQLVLHKFITLTEGEFGAEIYRGDQSRSRYMSAALLQGFK